MQRAFPLLYHIEELRRRLLKIIGVIIFTSILSYFFIDRILDFLQRPVGKLIFIHPTELFTVRLKLSLIVGLLVGLPFILYQIWAFIYEAIEAKWRRGLLVYILLSLLLFYGGVLFSYKLLTPSLIHFFLRYAHDDIIPMISVNSYISFLSLLIFSSAFIFQVPLFVLFFTNIGLLTPSFLKAKRRHVILLSFIIAAVITPPDVFTQIALALPLIILFEFSIFLSRISGYNRRKGR
jgi:sec-independent protein translocase protein TatC